MFSALLVSCLLAGVLGDKLPAGPEHRSVGYNSGDNGGYSASYDSDGAGYSAGAAGFRQGAASSNSFASASGFRQGSASFSGNSAGGGFRQGQNSISGGYQAGQAGFSAGGNSGGQYDNGEYRPQNLEGQFDNGEYRADELNAAFDDGAYKPTQYSGDDGLYKDDQYAPNTDASYQFEFDVGDHGRQEAADQSGEVEGNFYAVHPDGLRRDVEFTAGVDGFVVTKDESVQGPVPEYALRAAEKPKKVYPPAEIITSLSPDGIYHWEYDAGESSRSEDINLNTNYYEGTFAFTADDDQNRYRVDYVAGAGIGFVPTGDHLPQQVQETPEVAAAKQDFLEKFAVIEAEAKAARKNGYQQANQALASGYQASRQRPTNFQGQASNQGFRQQNNIQGFRQQQNNNQGYSAPGPQPQNQGFNQQGGSQGFRQQSNNQGFRQQSNNQGYSASNSQHSQGFRAQNNNQAFGQQGTSQAFSGTRSQTQSSSRAQGNQQISPYNPGYSASQSQSQTFIPTSQPQGRPHGSQQSFRAQAGSAGQGYAAPQQQTVGSNGGAFRQHGNAGAGRTQYTGAGSGQNVNRVRPQTASSAGGSAPAEEQVPEIGYSYLPPSK